MKLYTIFLVCSIQTVFPSGKMDPPLSPNNAQVTCIEDESRLQLHLAAKEGDINKLARAWNNDKKGLNKKNLLGKVPLFFAAQYHQEAAFLWLLEQNPQLTLSDYLNNSSIHYTAFFGSETMLLALLEKLKEKSQLSQLIDQTNAQGFSTLAWAILTGDVNKVSMLLSYGASAQGTVTFKRTYEQQLLYPIPDNSDEMVTYDMLSLACMAAPQEANTDNDCIVNLLLSQSSLPTKGRCRIANETPLHNRITWGSPSTVQSLLQKGAEPLAVTSSGDNALHRAARRGDSNIVTYLLDLERAIVERMIDAKNNNQETPGMIAQKLGHTEIYQTILTKKIII